MSDNKKRRNRWLAIGLILVPMAVACVYYTLFAVDRYSSSAQVVVLDPVSVGAAQAPGAAVLLSSVRAISRQETVFLYEYMTSPDMLAVLEEKLQWHRHYAAQTRDPWYWVEDDPSREDLLKYYQRIVTVKPDELTGLLNVEVQALSPQFANQTLKLILEQSEHFINDLSRQLARDQVRFAEEELVKARTEYEDKRDALVAFQSKNKLLDAQASAQSQAAIISSIESTLATERANLKALLSTLHSDSPQVRAQRTRISALESQLAAERNHLVSSTTGDHLNAMAAAYRKLDVDASIAEDAYKLSVAALQNAKIEANKKIHSLVTVVQPNMPQDASYPYKLYNLFTLLVVLFFIYGIVRFVIASIEDHRD